MIGRTQLQQYLLATLLLLGTVGLWSFAFAQSTGDTGTGDMAGTGDTTMTGDVSTGDDAGTGDDMGTGDDAGTDDMGTGDDTGDDSMTGDTSCDFAANDLSMVEKFKDIIDMRLAKHPWKAEFWEFRLSHLLDVIPKGNRVRCVVDQVHTYLLQQLVTDDEDDATGGLFERFRHRLQRKRPGRTKYGNITLEGGKRAEDNVCDGVTCQNGKCAATYAECPGGSAAQKGNTARFDKSTGISDDDDEMDDDDEQIDDEDDDSDEMMDDDSDDDEDDDDDEYEEDDDDDDSPDYVDMDDDDDGVPTE